MTLYDVLLQVVSDASNNDQVFWTQVGVWVTAGITILSALVTILRVILNAINNSNVIGHVLAPQVQKTTETQLAPSPTTSSTTSTGTLTSTREETTGEQPARPTGDTRISDR